MDLAYTYEVDLNWKGGRKGLVSSNVLENAIDVATPPEFPGGVAGIWSPEHLLVAAVNSCLMTTFLAIADNSKLRFLYFECHAKGKLEKLNGKYMISEILLQPVLTITDAADNDKAEKVLRKSEAACLISNSVKATIKIRAEIKTAGTNMKQVIIIDHKNEAAA